MKHKERLDVLLVSLGLAESRAKAQATIMAGEVGRLGGVRFWRVQRGPYATYFIPTINCVSLTNELLEKTDIGRTVMLGLKTPGAYLDLLEREYLAGNPAVTARRVYDKI